MARIKRITENAETGWSDWIYPLPHYRMFCCDCGLAHDLQFQVVRAGPSEKAGCFTILKEDVKNHRVSFRARRNVRSTAQVRRKPPQR